MGYSVQEKWQSVLSGSLNKGNMDYLVRLQFKLNIRKNLKPGAAIRSPLALNTHFRSAGRQKRNKAGKVTQRLIIVLIRKHVAIHLQMQNADSFNFFIPPRHAPLQTTPSPTPQHTRLFASPTIEMLHTYTSSLHPCAHEPNQYQTTTYQFYG